MPLFRVILGVQTQVIAYPLWILMVFVTLISTPKIRIREFKFFFIAVILFIISISLLDLFTGRIYLSSVLVLPILVSFMMLLIGYLNSDLFTIKFVKRLANYYIIATLILCIDIYFNYLRGYDVSVVTYVYRAKNSAGQLILTATVLLLFMFKPKGIKKLLKYGIIAFFLYVIIKMRSRASLVSFLIVPVVYILSYNVKNKYKIMLVCVLIITGFLLLENNLANKLMRNLLLNTTSSGSIDIRDFNRITSNRYQYLDTFTKLFKGHEFFGIGNYYMDNFFMAAFLNYGIFIGVLLVTMALYPIKVTFAFRRGDVSFTLAMRVIALTYFFNGFFEHLAPFGPGVKCFFLWLVIGTLVSSNHQLLSSERRSPNSFMRIIETDKKSSCGKNYAQ